jgi:hypothetical protein
MFKLLCFFLSLYVLFREIDKLSHVMVTPSPPPPPPLWWVYRELANISTCSFISPPRFHPLQELLNSLCFTVTSAKDAGIQSTLFCL